MNKKYAVIFENVCKIYKLKGKNNKHKDDKKFYALKNISFKVEKGEVVGILGSNGSGKSTLSLILAGISEPNRGKVQIDGEQALVAINIGLNNQLTGYENIKVKGALLGLSKKRVEEITEDVIKFAEIGDFIYQPVKKYSSGMKSRLGFAISIYLNPDIIIIDEALSVGDSAFSNKCLDKINEFKNEGKTIFFVSHSIGQVKKFCNKGIWIENGRLQSYGDIQDVAEQYDEYMKEYRKKTPEEKESLRQQAFNSRVIQHKRKKSIKKRSNDFLRKYKKSITWAMACFLVLSILFGGWYRMIYKNHKNKDSILQHNIDKENITYNYTFFIDGKDSSYYIDKHRVYLSNEGKAIRSIFNMRVNKEKGMEVVAIPCNTQVYYEKIKAADEFPFINLLTSNEEEKQKILESYFKEELNTIINISTENLFNFINAIGLEIEEREDNLEIFKENELIYLMDGNSEIEKIQEINKIIFEQLKGFSSEEIKEKVETLVGKDGEDEVDNIHAMIESILKDNLHKEIIAKNHAREINEVTLSQIINENYVHFFKTELMNKKLYYLKEKDLYENVYYKAIQKIIVEDIENESNEVDIEENASVGIENNYVNENNHNNSSNNTNNNNNSEIIIPPANNSPGNDSGGEGTEEEQEPVTPEEEPPKSDEPEIEEDNTPQ